MKTLEQYLKDNFERQVIDHSIRASVLNIGDGTCDVTFYIHADSKDSDTLDFLVKENVLMPLKQ